MFKITKLIRSSVSAAPAPVNKKPFIVRLGNLILLLIAIFLLLAGFPSPSSSATQNERTVYGIIYLICTAGILILSIIRIAKKHHRILSVLWILLVVPVLAYLTPIFWTPRNNINSAPVVHKSVIEDGVSNSTQKPAILQVSQSTNQSGPPVKLYAKSYAKIFSCQSETCLVIEELVPGAYWDLTFTPKGEWLNVLTKDNKSGYVKLADLISKEQFPNRCTTPLNYGIGYVSQKFIENGFDKARMTSLAQRAEEEWKNALGLDLFNYSSGETHNLINSRTYSYQVSDTYHWGTAFPYSLPNGTVLAFEIAIYEKIFDYYNKLSSDYYANIRKDEFLENEILQTLIHEFGHAIGFLDHIPGPQNIMFSGYENPEEEPETSFEEWENRGKTPPELTQADISAIKNWCSGN